MAAKGRTGESRELRVKVVYAGDGRGLQAAFRFLARKLLEEERRAGGPLRKGEH